MEKKTKYLFLKPCSGFTLMELMIVIAIIGIMSGIAIPNFIGWLPDYRLRNAARGLLTDVQQTRLLAVKNNQDCAIVFDTANKRYLICLDKGSDNSWSATNDNTVYKTVNYTNYKAGVDFGHGSATTSATVSGSFPGDNVSYGYNIASFNARGTCTAGWVYLDNNKNDLTYAVGTQSTGGVKFRHWNGNSWD